jgi:hypothetical protein
VHNTNINVALDIVTPLAAHNVTLADAFDQVVQIFNNAASGMASFDDLGDWFDDEVILRKSAPQGRKSIFVRKTQKVIKYFNDNFKNVGVRFYPYENGDPNIVPDSNYVMGYVTGAAKWVDQASPEPNGEPINFAFTFINEDNNPTATGDWKIVFLFGSNG